MTRVLLSILALASLPLGGCGYKPLSAPCTKDEGARPAESRPLSYAAAEPRLAHGAFASVASGDCGPMQPINAGRVR